MNTYEHHTNQSESAREKEDMKSTTLHILRSYIIAIVLTAVFAAVYNHFGHGVTSVFMNYAWIWPACGMFLALLFAFFEKPFTEPGRVFLRSGILTLTVGFLLQGVFEIAGTNSRYVPFFFAAGASLTAVSVVLLFLPVNPHPELPHDPAPGEEEKNQSPHRNR